MAGVNFTPKTASRLLKMSREVAPVSLRSQEFQETRQPIYFQNDSTEEIPPFACMKVTGATEVNGRAFVVVAKPDGDGGPFLFNNFRTVQPDAYGAAQSTPVVKVGYLTGSPGAGQRWGPNSDSWLLEYQGTDTSVLAYGSLQDDPGDKILLGNPVFPEEFVMRIGKADSTISYDNSGTVSLWDASSDTTDNVTAHLDWMHGDANISSGKEVLIAWFPLEGLWRIIGAECE